MVSALNDDTLQFSAVAALAALAVLGDTLRSALS